MEYREIRKFRDGTVMIEVNGVTSIVDAEMNEIIKKKNYPAQAARMLQDKFPHMGIKYVNDDVPGIAVSHDDDDAVDHYPIDEESSLEEIYGHVFDKLAAIEFEVCRDNYEYFIKHYLKK